MGSCSSSETVSNGPPIKYVVSVTTGDKKYGGTDSSVGLVLHGLGLTSERVWLDNVFENDFERGQTDEFTIDALQINDVEYIELTRGRTAVDDWLVDVISITNTVTGQKQMFPVYRWLKPKCSLKIAHLDSTLPQNEKFPEQRTRELEEKRKAYELEVKHKGMPPQVKKVPEEEKFSFSYIFDITVKLATLTVKAKVTDLFTPGNKWKSLQHIRNSAYSDTLPVPLGAKNWNDDKKFGFQRLGALNNCLIRLCRELPKKFPVTNEMVEPCLEGMTLQEALQQSRIFIVDLELLSGIPTSPNFIVCAPIALFFVNSKKDLMPIAIQLRQKPSNDNPIFLPTDPEWTWTTAKLWFNNADAAYQQSLTHLGFTHLIVESVCVPTHRQLSLSHPIFKLLAPHFLYVIQINGMALNVLIGKGAIVDQVMNPGRHGVIEIIRRRMKTWRLDVDGTLPEDLKERGVLSSDVLPKYYYRDDALKLYEAIKAYVSSYMDVYYVDDDAIAKDTEIQNWVKELITPAAKGGAGILGIPVGKNNKLENKQQLLTILTSVIFTASVSHAISFQQYDEFGYPPNYPLNMRGAPPTSKTALTEQDVLENMPDQDVTLRIMVITKLLSEKGTNSLGHFEVMYMHDPKVLACVHRFQEKLKEIGRSIKANNATRDPPYNWLDPEIIPNSISI